MYFQLENSSRADPPFKSVAVMDCVILGCANIWDLDRAYQTFEAISSTFGLNPNIHSYNALMSAFGKLKKVRLFSSPLFKLFLFHVSLFLIIMLYEIQVYLIDFCGNRHLKLQGYLNIFVVWG